MTGVQYGPDEAQRTYGSYARRNPGGGSLPRESAVGVNPNWVQKWSSSLLAPFNPRPWSRVPFENTSGAGTVAPDMNPMPGTSGAHEVPLSIFVDPEIPAGQRPAGSDPREITWASVDEAKSYFYSMSPAERAKITRQAAAYFGTNTPSVDQVQSYWNKAVEASYDLNRTQDVQMSPFESLASALPSGSDGQVTGTKRTSIYDSTGDETTNTVNLSSRTEAEALLRTAAQSLLGRNPTRQEIANFHARLNAQQQANPSTSRNQSSAHRKETTVTKASDPVVGKDGNITTADVTTNTSDVDSTSNVTTSGGVDSQVLAQQYAESRPDYAEYQAAKYMGLFQSMLGPAQGAVL